MNHQDRQELRKLADRAYGQGASWLEFINDCRSAFAEAALNRSHGNHTGAGRALGVSRKTITKAVRG